MTVWFGGTIWCDRCVRPPTHAKVEIQIVHGKLRPVLPSGWQSIGGIDDMHLCPKHPEGAPKTALSKKPRRHR